MPPVLHVAFFELMSGGQHDLLSRNLRTAVDECHHILQLISKTKCATRLIKRCASPDAARQRLVKQPAIEHRVECGVRSSDFDRAEKVVPVSQHFFKCRVDCS